MSRRPNRKMSGSKFVKKRDLSRLIAGMSETKSDGASIVTIMDENTAQTFDMTLIPEGTGVNERIGQMLQIRSVFARVGFGTDAGVTDGSYYGRVVLYSKRDESTADLNVGPFQNVDPHAYVIWFDKVVSVPWINTINNSHITVKKTWRPYMKAIYDSGSQGSILKGGVYLMMSTDCPTTSDIGIKAYYRVYFKDF